MSVKQIEDRYALDIYPKRDVVIVRGEGAKLWDDNGREYIDCASGIGVANIGHAHPAVTDAITSQASRLVTCPGIYYNDVRARLLERLVELAPAPLKRAFLCNSGTEAVEAALKVARHTTGRKEVIAAMRGYHGRTMGSLSVTFQKKYREPFEPLIGDVKFVPYNNPGKIDVHVTHETAAVILEPVQGEGGIRAADREYLHAVRNICDKHGALLIFDEIQTGFCRTGRMFALEHFDVNPDILCLAKAMGGGIPMGAIIVSEKIHPLRGLHGSTFGGNPLACAASLAAIDFMTTSNLSARATRAGDRFASRFRGDELSRVREVRQLGLMIGIELKERSQPIIVALMESGILALPAGPTVLRLLPPLVISDDEIDQVVDILHKVLD